jgi:hypothetical protein
MANVKSPVPASAPGRLKPVVRTKITEAEACAALKRSGYLLEHRVETALRRKGWYVEANAAYEDNETQKSRELDIYAIKGARVSRAYPDDCLFTSVLVECINNPQPVAFLTKRPVLKGWIIDDIKGTFDPEEVSIEGNSVNIGDLLKIASYHHYCRGRVATQFCSFSFKSDKKEWMALHDDVHFNAFGALTKALEYRFTQFEQTAGTYVNWEFINPVLVAQGDLLDVRTEGRAISLKRTEHVKYRRSVVWKGYERGYVVDVVTERAFPSFISMLERELLQTTLRVKRQIPVIRAALEAKYPNSDARNPVTELIRGLRTGVSRDSTCSRPDAPLQTPRSASEPPPGPKVTRLQAGRSSDQS